MRWKALLPMMAVLLAGALVAIGARMPLHLQTFNSGELSPLMNARSDYPKYSSGAQTLQNMIVRSQGPIQRRPGTRFVAEVKDSNDPARLIPFEYSTEDTYVIELGDEYARFYRAGAQITDVNGTYEIVTPWDANDLFELQFAQNAQYMRVVHPDYAPYKLTRTAHAAWTCTEVTFEDGPFIEENQDPNWTLTPSAVTGAITITASEDTFYAGHVGGLWRLTHPVDSNSINGDFTATGFLYPGGRENGSAVAEQLSSTLAVAENQDYTVTTTGYWYGILFIQKSYDDGSTWRNVYSHTGSGNVNVQYNGTETLGDAIYRLRMQDHWGVYYHRDEIYMTFSYDLIALDYERQGIVEITAVNSATDANATVIYDLGGTAATYKWAEGYWSDYRGFPRTIEFYEQRCVYGGSDSFPQTVWASVTAEVDADYDDFGAGVGNDDDAWTYVLPGMNPIQWLKAQQYLMVGTSAAIGRLGTEAKALTPTWTEYKIQAKTGCDYQQPVQALDALLFVERGKRNLREIQYTYTTETFTAADMTILAEHITDPCIVEIDWQERPDPVLYGVRGDGQMLTFTYNKQHEVQAWSRWVTGQDVNDWTSWDDFESVVVIPGSSTKANGDDRTDDEVWAVVNRLVDSNQVRYVEQFQSLDWGDDPNYCWFVDCAGYGTSGGNGDLSSGTNQYPTLQGLTAPEIPGANTLPSETALAGEISVTNKAGLQGMTPGNHYSIDGDIDASGAWTPLDFDSASDIVIEGNGNTISNLALTSAASDNQGFIATIEGAGAVEIRNLNFISCSVEGDDEVAIVCSKILTSGDVFFKNITVSGSTLEAETYAGFIVGVIQDTNVYLSDCDVTTGTFTDNGSAVLGIGGLVGRIINQAANTWEYTVQDCDVSSTAFTANGVTSTKWVGALVGQAIGDYYSSQVITSQYHTCTASDITMTLSSSRGAATSLGYLGGAFGQCTSAEVVSCTANAAMTITPVGDWGNVTVNNYAITRVGGFAGLASEGMEWTDCSSAGSIIIADGGADVNNNEACQLESIGGFVGRVEGGATASHTRCYSTTSITVNGPTDTWQAIGGYVGRSYLVDSSSSLIYDRCFCSGDIAINATIYDSGLTDAGGFCGAFEDALTGSAYGTVQDCYTWSSITNSVPLPTVNYVPNPDVNEEMDMGGFVSYAVPGSAFDNTYCAQTNAATGSSLTGQLTDSNRAMGWGESITRISAGPDVTASFYDTTTSSLTTSPNAVGHITSWMMTKANYEAAGWDFTTIWYMPTTSGSEWSGQTHTVGLSECVYADGRPIGSFTVDANGVIDLVSDYSVVIAGLNYYSIYESFPLGNEAMASKSQITQVKLDFFESMGCNLGATYADSTELHFSDDDFATAMAPWSGIKVATFPRGVSREPVLYLWIWSPVPMSIRALRPTMNVFSE